MIVVDTNILVYLLIEAERTGDARALFSRDANWHSESFALIEFSNVLTTAVRVRGLARHAADDLLATAQELLHAGSHGVAHALALEFACRYSVSAYDARFLAVADELDTRLVTEDVKLRRHAPDLTMSLADALVDA